MKTICAVQASFQVTPLGTRSRLADPLAGVSVLRRTVQQIRKVTAVESVFILVSESEASHCREILKGLEVVIQCVESNPPPWARLVRASRKWSLDG